MNARQQVFRVRRNYNRWVANETLEDYALRFTAKKARRWTAARISNTALGAISFLALEAIGGAITVTHGFTNAVAATLAVGLIIFLTAIPICYHAARQGVDIDLLTRGAGFGYIGSTITSLIYASFTFIFFALEAAILALALQLTLDCPLYLGYFISAVVVIPLVTHGITLISRFQVWTQPIWLVLQLLPLICIALQSEDALALWANYSPPGEVPGFNLMAFGAAAAVLFSLIAQVGEQVDFLRFMPADKKPGPRWWGALLIAGPGWIISGTIKILIGSFLAVLALSHGVGITQATDPNYMYLTAFGYVTSSPELMLILTGTFVVLSQLKINVTNAYAGSIAWSNFFSRLTHNHPGRVVWLVFNVAIALMLMELGIYRVLEEILSVYSIVAVAWVGTLVADLVINRPLKLRPAAMEFKRAHLYDINPVGVGSMLIASVIGFVSLSGVLGEAAQALYSFATLLCCFIAAPLIAWLTRGQYYIAREPVIMSDAPSLRCCICEHHFEHEDMAHCPAYAGPICSLCCSLDGRCHDMCKTDARFSEQIVGALGKIMPANWVARLNSRVGHFLGLFFFISVVMAALLSLVFFQLTLDSEMAPGPIVTALTNVYYILLIVCGVAAWMYTLGHESRRFSQEETRHQTKLLMNEIEAHKQTDLQLQKSMKIADAANAAKSRYLTGISHELRSPLNAIMGYAQLLDKDTDIAPKRREALAIIRRSSEYLSDLIEGLLDISRIEAGRLELNMTEVDLGALLEQLVSMFRLQAQAKGIEFEFDRLTPLPQTVRADEKRLRQILINLLSNAVKFTHTGKVRFTVSYSSLVANFVIEDSGVGIDEENMERIFRPFERVRKPGEPHVTGTGLGLTITRLLTDIMGGDLAVSSTPGSGSCFNVKLLLSSTTKLAVSATQDRQVLGYHGDTKTIFVVDDEPTHRSLLQDLLEPLGFNIIQAPDAGVCLEMLRLSEQPPDLFLLDITMPGMSGWELARILRRQWPKCKIFMISADAYQRPQEEELTDQVAPNDAYLVKPLKISQLLPIISKHLPIVWHYAQPAEASAAALNAQPLPLSESNKQDLIRLAKIGYANGIRDYLAGLREEHPESSQLLDRLQEHARHFNFGALIKLLEESL